MGKFIMKVLMEHNPIFYTALSFKCFKRCSIPSNIQIYLRMMKIRIISNKFKASWVYVILYHLKIPLVIIVYNKYMISSSNFFKKTFFTKQNSSDAKRTIQQAYGPWYEEPASPGLSLQPRKTGNKNRYGSKEYFTIDEDREQLNKSDIASSMLLKDEHSLIAEYSREKSLKTNKNKAKMDKSQKLQTKLPVIKINQYQTQHLRNKLLKLQSHMLNFITNNHQKSLKKFVSKKEEAGPRFQIYRKCIIAARKMAFDGHQNSFFNHR